MKMVLYLTERPLSGQAKLRRGYQSRLRAAALQRTGGALTEGPLYSRVIWFHRYPSHQGDTDNILKPIHDALKGAAYADDGSIVRTASFRIDIMEGYAVDSDPQDPESAFALFTHLDQKSNRDILYIEVGEQVETRVRLGPIL